MFSLADTNSDDDFDITQRPSGLSNIFDSERGDGDGSLSYKAPRQPTKKGSSEKAKPASGKEGQGITSEATAKTTPGPREMGKEEKDERNNELVGYEPLYNIQPGVKMATAVNAFKFENNGQQSLGKLGLAIIGSKESNFYQLLLYRGKQQPVAVTNILPTTKLEIQTNNFANFVDNKNNSWTVGFDSEDLLTLFAKQFVLCKTIFRYSEALVCDLKAGEGNAVTEGDMTEVNVTGWLMENQSLGSMRENITAKRCKVGAHSSGAKSWEAFLTGLRKGSRRFVVDKEDNDNKFVAYLIQVTRTKTKDVDPSSSANAPTRIPSSQQSEKTAMAKVKQLGQSVMIPIERSNAAANKQDVVDDADARGAVGKDVVDVDQRIQHERDQNILKEQVVERKSRRQSIQSTQGSVHSESFDGASATRSNYFRQDVGGPELGRQEMNLLLTETRLSNTELRMNMTRISDKIDQLIQQSGHSSTIKGFEPNNSSQAFVNYNDLLMSMSKDLETIKSETGLIKVKINTTEPTENADESKKISDLKEAMEAKVTQIGNLEDALKKKQEEIDGLLRNKEKEKEAFEQLLKEKLQESEDRWREEVRLVNLQTQADLKKVVSSAAKFMLNQFKQSESYPGNDIQTTVRDTLAKVNQRINQKFNTSEDSAETPTNQEQNQESAQFKTETSTTM